MKKLMMAVMMAAAMVATADDFGFTYQAELKDAKGNNLSTQNQVVEIRLWKTAATSDEGDLLWGRTYNIFTDKNGLFNQEISDSTGSQVADWPSGKTVLPLSTIFCNNGAGTVYLGLKVKGSSGEIVPRQRLFAVPFAGKANSANNLVGSTHNVEGALKIGSNAELSPNGLTLPASSSSTMGVVEAERITCNGELKVASVSLTTGKLTGADSKEIVPVPVGGIIMWTKSSLPDSEHWAICDGSTKNGVTTPDLRGRFVVGVGKSSNGDTTYSAGNAGGEEKHTLTVDETASHRHIYLSHQVVNWNGSSSELIPKYTDATGITIDFLARHMGSATSAPTISDASYFASLSRGEAVGGDQAHENRPPYYALYYIMRVK